MRRIPLLALITAGLLLATLIAYRDVGRFGFVNLDDDAYVVSAPMVNQGVRPAAVVWAFTSVHTANWHPLTSLSHMLDCHLFGIRATPMHWENLLWHMANTVLVFLIWQAMSGAVWRSAFVAALFALHPLHVESVAWISSRKDLLCTFFWLLGIAAYLRWTRRPSFGRYAVIAVCLAVALLFKPMAVTLPCTLLLIDGWPLRRWPGRTWMQLLREKIPLFAVVVLHSVITFVVQHNAGAAAYAERIPFDARLGNAVVAFARYFGKTFWPESLSPLYWHPGYWPLWAVAGGLVLLAGVSVIAWRQRATRPWLAFGWLWFIGTLVPVIGIVQVGVQSMADRYTYVPLLGLFTIVSWAVAELAGAWPRIRPAVVIAAVAVIVACVFLSRRQALAWESSTRLYESSIAAGEDNAAIRYLLGTALAAAGRPEAEVAAQFNRAIELQPDYVNAHTQLALLAMRQQRFDEAQARLEKNVRFEPRNPSLLVNLGSFWTRRGDAGRGLKYYQEALRLSPNEPGIHRELAQLHAGQNRPIEARDHYEAALRADPWNAMDWANLGFLLGNMGYLSDARRHFERALWIDPANDSARRNLAAIAQLEAGRKTGQPKTK